MDSYSQLHGNESSESWWQQQRLSTGQTLLAGGSLLTNPNRSWVLLHPGEGKNPFCKNPKPKQPNGASRRGHPRECLLLLYFKGRKPLPAPSQRQTLVHTTGNGTALGHSARKGRYCACVQSRAPPPTLEHSNRAAGKGTPQPHRDVPWLRKGPASA